MPATLSMPKKSMSNRAVETSGTHTTASLEHVAAQIKAIADRLTVAISVMKTAPTIEEVTVRYERSLRDGLKSLENWSDEVRQVIHDRKLDSLR